MSENKTPFETLVDLLEGAGARLTFSQYCISGITTERCECSRCRADRGQLVTPETEEIAATHSEIASRRFRDRATRAGTIPRMPKV